MQPMQFIFEYRDYPLIPVKFTFKKRETPIIDALLDSGGDFIVIPNAIAKYLGLKLIDAGCVDTAGGETTLYKTTVDLVIKSNKKEYLYKNLEIHVSDSNDIPVLLGRKPIFEDHEITFKKYESILILTQVPKHT
ncbi:MAG: retropepsin-like domain-containing protein [Candidatus Thermoplasmatota archaeon]|nr:retropepsin-like domain-containing protein [Candidatus Thermoplasmatota archaeon]MBU1941919.1 retropepsin-like domain-containing protein [Candidatus Thermoplasmatota archaeon]